MDKKIKVYLSSVLCLAGILFFSSAFAQQALPAGGSDFGTAVLLSPGKYQGGPLQEWQNPIYYSIQVKAGQEINAEAKYFSQSGCTVALYNEAQEELISNYDTSPKIKWLANADKSSYKYYLRIANDASAVESFTLEVSLTNYYDANSGTDAGDTFDKAVTIAPGTYNGYLTGFSGIMNSVGDDWQDIYKVGVKKVTTYEFKITPPSKTSLTLGLYDLNRQLLKEESSVNPGGVVSLFLTPSSDTSIFVSVLNDEYAYQDALANYQLEIKFPPVPPQKFYTCEGEYCELVGEFVSKEDCQKSTTKTCYQTENCDNKCGIVPPPAECTKNSDCPTGKICKNSKCESIIPPSGCTKDSDCPAGNVCKDGKCEESPLPLCQDECTANQTKCFDNFNYHKCGNYDDDECLEWSTPVYCGEGNKCENGKCVVTVGCQCSAWMEGQCGASGCSQDEMSGTRICIPANCDIEKLCTSNSSCQIIPPPPPPSTNWFGFLKGFGAWRWFSGWYIIFWVLFYIYLAICLQILAKKTGTRNGWMAWIPIANIFLMIQISQKPLWWFVLILIPIVNIVIAGLIWMKIAERRGKPNWVGILIIVPPVGIAVPGYLAFFDYKKGEKIEITPPYVPTGTEEANKPTVGYKHPCKYCGKLVPPNSIVCPLCGKANPLGPYRCPKCHEPIEKEWQVCPKCNQNLRIVCPFCGKVTFFGDHCEDCGARLLVKCPYCGQEQPPISDKCIKCGQSLERKVE